MTAQPLFQFGTVTLNPAPDRRVIGLQTAFGEQLFDIAERERVPKIPAHGTKNQLRRRLPPLEDCRSGCVLHDLFRLPATPAKVATHPAIARRSKPPTNSRGSSFEEPQRSSFSMGHSGAAAQPVAHIALSPAAGMLERIGGKDAQVSIFRLPNESRVHYC
jgi:hypothetical protein